MLKCLRISADECLEEERGRKVTRVTPQPRGQERERGEQGGREGERGRTTLKMKKREEEKDTKQTEKEQ